MNTYVWPQRAAPQTWDVETMVGTKVAEINRQGSAFAVSPTMPLVLGPLSSVLYRSRAEVMSAIGLHLRGRCEEGGHSGH